MDIDNSDFDLISSFRTMNTNDKDHLIAEFKRLSNTELSNEGCVFYLDLAEWNLNTALWAYYEYQGPGTAGAANAALHYEAPPQMKLVNDVTIGAGESVAPSTRFVKTWRLKNSSFSKPWPQGCYLKLIDGFNHFEGHNADPTATLLAPITPVPSILPQQTTDVSIHLCSPAQPGIYHSQFRLFSGNETFGDAIWLVLCVEPGGVLGITQQLNSAQMQQQQQQGEFESPNANTANWSPSSTSTNNSAASFTSTFSISPTFQAQQQQQSSNETKSEPTVVTEERPDFYDDMFS